MLSENGYGIYRIYPGIYYVKGGMFPCQIVVIRKLKKEDHLWLKILTDTVEDGVISAVRTKVVNETKPYNRQLMKSVLHASINANRDQFKTEEEAEMDAIKELFGYDFEEVNEKLEKAQKDKEKAEKENIILKDKIKALEQQLAALS